MEEAAIGSSSGKCQSEGDKISIVHWAANMHMCILILTNDLLTLCTYSMRERCYSSEEDDCGTEHNFLCQVLTRAKKNNLHACTDALAYVQGHGPWTEKNQRGSSVGDSRESGSSEEHTSLPLHKRTLSRSQSVFLQNPVTDPDYS